MSELLKQTGYSYSGISDILNNEPELKNKLLFEIDKEYCRLRDQYQEASKKAQLLESNLRTLVSCFIHFKDVMMKQGVINEEKLTYSKEKDNVLIHFEGTNTIKYTYYKRADL